MKKRGFFDKSDGIFIGLNLLGAVVLVILILVCLIAYLRNYTQHGVEVEVADIRGMLQADAQSTLEQQGLQLVVIDSTYSDVVPFGTIVDQDPLPKSHAKQGRAVYVIVNSHSKRQIAMPDLQDVSYRQAESTLRGLGIEVDSIYDYEPSMYRDLVLDVKCKGKSIKPGEQIPVGTKVRLVVGFGRGTEEVEVPNLIGSTLLEARSTLLSHRLTIGAVYQDTPQEDGVTQYVYRQIPSARSRLVEGETVNLYLSADIQKAVLNREDEQEEEETWF